MAERRTAPRGRRAWPTWVLLGWVLLAVGADFLASEHPIVMRRGAALFILPNLIEYDALRGLSGHELSQSLGPEGWALWTPVRHGPTAVRGAEGLRTLAPPSASHWLGTDDRGRDVLARLIHGARASAALAAGAAALALALALFFALLAARVGGAFARVVAFGAAAIAAVPVLVLVVAAQGLLGKGGLGVAIALVALPRAAETLLLLRASLSASERSVYVAAARAAGASRGRTLLHHGLRDAVPVMAVSTALTLSTAVLAEAALSFLGVGVSPPAASWGELLRQAYDNGFPLAMAVPAGLLLAGIAAALDRGSRW